MIIWFGTGLKMKIVLAFLSTVFITAFQTYEGASKKSESDDTFFQNQSCYQQTTLLDALIPSLTGLGYPITQTECRLLCFGSIHWQFIASEAGLGYIILKKASGLYDTTYVFAAIICIILLSMFFNLLAVFVNKYKLRIIRFGNNEIW